MNIYYIYFYLRSDYTPYYIGKGKNKRAWTKSKKEIAPPKDSSKIILVEKNLTELQAFILERYYISWFGRKDLGTGILRNRTNGGEGHSGFKQSNETKQKRAISNMGKTRNDSTKQKISTSKKGKSTGLVNVVDIFGNNYQISKEQYYSLKNYPEKDRKYVHPNSIEGRKRKNTPQEKYKKSIEKMSEATRGKKKSIETKEKMSTSKKGKPTGLVPVTDISGTTSQIDVTLYKSFQYGKEESRVFVHINTKEGKRRLKKI